MQRKYLLILIAVNVCFLVVGGIIFHFIEYPSEDKAITYSKANYITFRDEALLQINANGTCMTEDEFDELVQAVITKYDNGEIFVDDSHNWDITGSIFFATTVVSTIGYGHISPSTSGGKVFCIFYALVGIPLCLIMLGEIGIRLSESGQRLDKRLNHGWFPKYGAYFRPVIVTVIGFLLFVFIPALIISVIEEDWNYGTALYYCIITLTTVGFGDYVAGHSNSQTYHWVYQIAVSCWIMIGLAWVANVIANCQEIYKDIGEDVLDDEDDDLETTKSPQVNCTNSQRQGQLSTKL